VALWYLHLQLFSTLQSYLYLIYNYYFHHTMDFCCSTEYYYLLVLKEGSSR
jgi:hypothetical protein